MKIFWAGGRGVLELGLDTGPIISGITDQAAVQVGNRNVEGD